MAGRRWDRLRGRRAKRAEREGTPPARDTRDSVRIEGDEHAWWAARDELEHGWRPKPNPPADGDAAAEGFEGYYSTDSLFVTGEVGDGHELVTVDQWSNPYEVLGVLETATWEEITRAHRRFAKVHHPDRLLSSSDEERAASERRMRELNLAYTELRRLRGR